MQMCDADVDVKYVIVNVMWSGGVYQVGQIREELLIQVGEQKFGT